MTQEESNVANDGDDQTGIANESAWKFVNQPFRRRHQYACSLYYSLYISYLVLTREIHLTIKNFFILVTLKHDSGVILEIRCYEVLLGDQRINF